MKDLLYSLLIALFKAASMVMLNISLYYVLQTIDVQEFFKLDFGFHLFYAAIAVSVYIISNLNVESGDSDDKE